MEVVFVHERGDSDESGRSSVVSASTPHVNGQGVYSLTVATCRIVNWIAIERVPYQTDLRWSSQVQSDPIDLYVVTRSPQRQI